VSKPDLTKPEGTRPSQGEPGETPVAIPARYHSKRSAIKSLLARFGGGSAPALSAMVEVADRCNEACVHCYQVQGQKGELSTAELKKVFAELAELGVLMLTISGGEPTLRKDFLELVAYARELKFAVKVYSNGLNITRALAQELGRLAVQEVQLSLYSDRAELHDQVTRVRGSFDKTVAATRHLREAGVKVVVKSPLMRANMERVPEYAEFVTSLGAEYSLDRNLVLREDGSAEPREVWIDERAYVSISRQLSKPKPQHQVPLRARPCAACSQNVHIEANGELRPCALWNVPTGHALAQGGITQAWHENGSALAIRALTWGALPACRVCDLRSYCSRCFAQAQLEVGDARSPYENACQRARWEYEARHGRAPEIEASSGSASIGPYRHISEHRFLREDYVHSDEDQALLAKNPWLRAACATDSTQLDQLVQLRRAKD
jgi:radical SAM protein with 4Fe4S-binding SPASM domain